MRDLHFKCKISFFCDFFYVILWNLCYHAVGCRLSCCTVRAWRIWGEIQISLEIWLMFENLRDVVPRVPVKSLLQALLIHVVTDEADTATKHEKWVDGANVDVFLGFLAANFNQISTKFKSSFQSISQKCSKFHHVLKR